MQFRVDSNQASTVSSDALVVPVFSGEALAGTAEEADRQLGGLLSEALANGEFEAKSNEVALFHSTGANRRVLAVGLGERAKFVPSQLAQYAGTAVRYLGRRKVRRLAFALPTDTGNDAAALAAFVAEGALSGTLDTTLHRTKKERAIEIDEIALLSRAGAQELPASELERGVERGRAVGEAVVLARTLALEPANRMTPSILAERASELAKDLHLEIDVLGRKRMEELGMGALLGVSKGSEEPPRLIVIEYRGDPDSSEKIALVGKGITFDSGGISIKPSERMEEMKYDMSGAAAVIAAIGAVARLGLKANVVAIAPASENLPSGSAQKPGDVVKAMDGQTIEVINTDAEGRLILVDALAYARKLGATRIIDVATLTGAIVVSLGHAATGTMTNDEAFVSEFLRVADTTGERYWQLPLYDEFTQTVKSEIADWRNSTGREAGSLTAGAFLKAFVGSTPWIHLDIAGTAYVDKEAPYQAKGPTGSPVRALVAFVESVAKGAGVHTNGLAKKADAPAG